MCIRDSIYGSPDETEDGRPYIVYSLNEDGTAPKISDILGFYPVKEKQGESGYEADTSKPVSYTHLDVYKRQAPECQTGNDR